MIKRFKKYRLLLFVVSAVAQLIVIGQMIAQRELAIAKGITIKIPCGPYDPHDPFRGRYVEINARPGEAQVVNKDQFNYNKPVYLTFNLDAQGVASSNQLTQEKPPKDTPYIEYFRRYPFYEDKVQPIFPISRFYMNEKQAPAAEERLQRGLDTNEDCFLVLKLNRGTAVPVEILVGDDSFK